MEWIDRGSSVLSVYFSRISLRKSSYLLKPWVKVLASHCSRALPRHSDPGSITIGDPEQTISSNIFRVWERPARGSASQNVSCAVKVLSGLKTTSLLGR